MDYQYRINGGQYVLHDGDDPIGPLLEEVAIAFDRESGTLHKHGSPEMVENWVKNARQKFNDAGYDKFADDLVTISGKFPLEDLNKFLTHTGYIGLYFKRQMESIQDAKPSMKP